MIKFSNYKVTRIPEIFEGFTILSEEELEDRIQKSYNKTLFVFGGFDLKVEQRSKKFMLCSDYIYKGSVGLPVNTYFRKFKSEHIRTRTINLWFTSKESAEKFLKKFYYKFVNYTGDINRYTLIISER